MKCRIGMDLEFYARVRTCEKRVTGKQPLKRFSGKRGYAGMRICGYAGMRICGYADMRICGYADMRVCGYAGMRVCGYAGMRICGHADMRVCGYAGMRVRRTGLITNRFQKLINNSCEHKKS